MNGQPNYMYLKSYLFYLSNYQQFLALVLYTKSVCIIMFCVFITCTHWFETPMNVSKIS